MGMDWCYNLTNTVGFNQFDCALWPEEDFALTSYEQRLCSEPCSFKHDWGQLQTRAYHVCVWVVTVVCWHQLGLLSLNKDHLHCQLKLSKKYYICIQNQELYISHIHQPQPLSSVCFYRGHCCCSCRHPRETRAFKGLFGSWITIWVRNCWPAPCFQIIMVADSKSKELSTNWWHWNGCFDIGRRDERSKESDSTNSMISVNRILAMTPLGYRLSGQARLHITSAQWRLTWPLDRATLEWCHGSIYCFN
jgi:hypothetical protein